MEYNTKDISEGKYIGQTVWVCDFRYNDFDNKPIRRIPPTQVIIRNVSETNKAVNYSNCFFSEVKNGKILNSSDNKLYDNTGYRSFPGVALKVFTTGEECINAYKKLAKKEYKAFHDS